MFDDDFDDIEAPLPPAKKSSEDYDVVETTSLRATVTDLALTPSDCIEAQLPKIQQRILVHELETYDVFTHNIVRGFGYATTIDSLISLVKCGLQVNEQRRRAVRELTQAAQSDTVEMDVFGNVIPRK